MKDRKVLIGIAVLGCIGLIIAIVLFQLSKPASGKILSPGRNSTPTASGQSWIKLDAKLYTVEYLNDYVIKQADLHTGGNNFFLIEDGLITKHLGLAAGNMGGHGLSDEPSFMMRTLTPETYKLEYRIIANQKIPVMERLDHTEQVAYIVKDSKLGTIALTTGDPSHPPYDELNHMITSWTWK